jgi:rhodanese-related sulfurtransferase
LPTLDEVLAEARSRLDRVNPDRFQSEVDAGALVIDVRDSALIDVQGPLAGATPINLTILEWRLAPSSDSRIFDIEPDQRVILVCNEGFSSSLAAARLQDLGVSGATDVVGGFTALTEWQTTH